MQRLQGLAAEVLALPNLTAHQRLMWATSLRLDAVPVQERGLAELPPWFWERQNITRRTPGVDLLSLDGRRGIRCCAEAVEFQQVRRFLRLAKWVYKASDCVMVTSSPDVLSKQSQKWLRRSKAKRQTLSFTAPRRSRRLSRKPSKVLQADSSDPPLRPCQRECLEACAKGARVIEMACGTGKTRVMKELVRNISGRVLLTVPLRALLEQFAEDFPGFCKVGTGYNKHINWNAKGFLAVTDSVRMLKRLEFDAIFVDEAHHPQAGFPKTQDLYRFSATHWDEPDFRYSMGQAMEDRILCDYDLTVPVVTPHHGHTYLSLADLLLKQAGRFRRILAYCNSVQEAKSFRMVLRRLGMAAWHMNDFRYSMGQAMEDRILCDYDLTVPVVTPHHGHTYLSLASLLSKQAGRFRRVLAYCNSVREAKNFLIVLEKLGMAAWHMNGDTPPKKRKEILEQFAGALRKPVHVLVTVEVLGEGINIPNADTCMFVEPRSSYRSIVQAIGRVLRPHPAKPLAHIVLPAVALPPEGSTNVLGGSFLFKCAQQVIDCTAAQHVKLDEVTCAVHAELAAVLRNTDPWEVRFRELEDFVSTVGRLPKERVERIEERTLGHWLTSQGKRFRANFLLPHRLHKLLNASSPLLRERVQKWLSPRKAFEQKCQELQEHIEATGSPPSFSCESAERKLAIWLYAQARHRKLSTIRRRILEDVHPSVKDLLRSWAKTPVRVNAKLWHRRRLELLDFVAREGCLPTDVGGRGLYSWLQLQRRRFHHGQLPAELMLELQRSHPLIAELLHKRRDSARRGDATAVPGSIAKLGQDKAFKAVTLHLRTLGKLLLGAGWSRALQEAAPSICLDYGKAEPMRAGLMRRGLWGRRGRIMLVLGAFIGMRLAAQPAAVLVRAVLRPGQRRGSNNTLCVANGLLRQSIATAA
ncbi:unnamed protein product [Effrenium voratum]|nr:unnamed protein product [Effrenium voratum]